MKKNLALLVFSFVALSVAAQNNLPVLKAKNNPVISSEDGVERPWFISPDVRPDVMKTSAKNIVFRSSTDTLSFKLEEGKAFDFIVLTNENDSAFTRVEWVSDNPLQNPPKRLLGLSATGKMSREQAVFDIDALVYNLSEIHPDMYAQCGMGEFMHAVAEVKSALPDSLSKLELYEHSAPLVSMLGDGHTIMRFPFNDVFTSELKREPFLLSINDNDSTVSVRKSACPALPDSVQLKSINGIEVRDMVAWMMNYASGERPFFKLSRVNDLFPALFQMRYAAESYDVEFIADGKIKQATVPAMTFSELKAAYSSSNKPGPKKSDLPYFYEIPDGKKYAILTFNACADEKRMAVFADSMVTELNQRKIKHLIIDVRYNGGGNSMVGEELLKRISNVPFNQFGRSYCRVTPTVQRLMNQKADAGIYCFAEPTKMIQPLDAEHRFQGKTIMLISHKTFSSAADFSWTFKYFNMGVVVGEETGGMSVCFGDYLNYRLPVSGLFTSISYKRFWQYGADEKDIHGTVPDYIVPQAEALEFAKRLTKKRK
ncbi:S41 family peptidase [Bacteroides helcogenes]|uniref:Peptidase S41 n=1 Tax=Bacteroides helcogenes (strain ATCC 35417 / DSM 20613 / JCM 6297 / CCUG 15421 / P 36-108) TaxID=693979 RepID=E6SNU8_BACT6|nr:S41 family peptidase [Bacteroides helcogenes]ADV42766.1 peptidase S41 [Bacteroides helcogenes P 36-108]MDY5239598.1 S41 family peptidase [Bacteroides helcogenes]